MSCAVRPTNIGNGMAKLDVDTGDVKVWHMPGGLVGESSDGLACALTVAEVAHLDFAERNPT